MLKRDDLGEVHSLPFFLLPGRWLSLFGRVRCTSVFGVRVLCWWRISLPYFLRISISAIHLLFCVQCGCCGANTPRTCPGGLFPVQKCPQSFLQNNYKNSSVEEVANSVWRASCWGKKIKTWTDLVTKECFCTFSFPYSQFGDVIFANHLLSVSSKGQSAPCPNSAAHQKYLLLPSP